MTEPGGNLTHETITRTAPKPKEFNWDSVPEYKDEEPPVHAPAMKPVTDLRTGYKPLEELAESEKVETPKKNTSGVQQMFKDTRESAPKIAEQARSTNERRIKEAEAAITAAEKGASKVEPDLLKLSIDLNHSGWNPDPNTAPSKESLSEFLEEVEAEIKRLNDILKAGNIRDIQTPETNVLMARFEVVERQINTNLALLTRLRDLIYDKLNDMGKTAEDRREDEIRSKYQEIRQKWINDRIPPKAFRSNFMRNLVLEIAALRVDLEAGKVPDQDGASSASAFSQILASEPPVTNKPSSGSLFEQSNNDPNNDPEATKQNQVVIQDRVTDATTSDQPPTEGESLTYEQCLAQARQELADILDLTEEELNRPNNVRLIEEIAGTTFEAQANRPPIPSPTALGTETPTIPAPPAAQAEHGHDGVLPIPGESHTPENAAQPKRKSILTRALNRLRIRRRKPTPEGTLPPIESPVPTTPTVETRTPEDAVIRVLAAAGLSHELIKVTAQKSIKDYKTLTGQERRIIQGAIDLRRILQVMKDKRDKKPVKAMTLEAGLVDAGLRGFSFRDFLAVRGEIRKSAKLVGVSESTLIGKVIDALPIKPPSEVKIGGTGGIV